MSHTPSAFMYRIRSEYRNRIKYLELADELFTKHVIEFQFRNQIIIRYLIIDKFILPQMKYKSDEHFVNYPYLIYSRTTHNDFWECSVLG